MQRQRPAVHNKRLAITIPTLQHRRRCSRQALARLQVLVEPGRVGVKRLVANALSVLSHQHTPLAAAAAAAAAVPGGCYSSSSRCSCLLLCQRRFIERAVVLQARRSCELQDWALESPAVALALLPVLCGTAATVAAQRGSAAALKADTQEARRRPDVHAVLSKQALQQPPASTPCNFHATPHAAPRPAHGLPASSALSSASCLYSPARP